MNMFIQTSVRSGLRDSPTDCGGCSDAPQTHERGRCQLRWTFVDLSCQALEHMNEILGNYGCSSVPFLSLLAGFLLFAGPHLCAEDKTWFGGNGNWANPANWSPVGVPTETDHAILNGGSPAVNSDIQIDRLTLDGGGLEGDGTITVTNLLWKSGSMSGPGTTGVPVGGSAVIDGSQAKTLNRVFRN